MLYSVPDMKEINQVPHQQDYSRWRSALDRANALAFQEIHTELDSRFDTREVDTSSWIPGANWENTLFQPIYIACGGDDNENAHDEAAKFFGLIVWKVVMDRDDCWSFGRYEKDGFPIRGMTYFRIDCP
jgi:hypothetical protein